MRRLVAQCEALIRAVLPEAKGQPVYVVLRQDGSRYAAAGLWTPCLDLAFKQEIGSRWRGRGVCVLINPAVISCALHGLERRARCRAVRAYIFGVVLHELAHAIVGGGLSPEPTSAAYAGFVRVVLEETFSESEPPRPTPWHGHELPWIRACMHLASRARMLGYRVSCWDVCDTGAYRLSSTVKYLMALGDEPRRMPTWTFDRILRTSPPDAFCKLWKSDTISAKDKKMKLLERLKDRRHSVAEKYRALVRNAASGKTVNVDDAAKILDAAGKSDSDLTADLERVGRRKELSAKLIACRSAEPEIAPLKEKIAEADKALEEVIERHNAAVWPLQARVTEIKEGLRAASAISDELVDSADDHLLDELQQACARVSDLSTERSSTMDECELIERARSDAAEAEREAFPTNQQHWLDKAESNRARGLAAKLRLPKITKKLAEAEAEEARVRERMEVA